MGKPLQEQPESNLNSLPEYKTIVLSLSKGVLTIAFNRPDRMNAMNEDMFSDLSYAVDTAFNNHDVRVVVFTGSADVFSSGGDLISMTDYHSVYEREDLYRIVKNAQEIFDHIEMLPKPTIAAINGHAVGAGLQLAVACDFRIAVKTAKLGLKDVKIGIIPGLGGTKRLPDLIGIARAKEMIMLGDEVAAGKAFEMGLVNLVVEKDDLKHAVQNMAEKLCANAPLALSAAKDLINRKSSLDQVAHTQANLLKTVDAGEGIRAFLEKRIPCFKGV
jgi:enoyl-CoA hydratase